ncbi:MAG: hypothetical protein KDD36_04885 [Flavobacteriales bacterium]|nr:hypothetical protein [Flavobacteriales bacterium]
MKKYGILLLAMGCTTAIMAQQERSVFSASGRAGVSTSFVTDYQTIGINPANLGLPSKYPDKHVSFGFFEWAHSIHSEALTKPDLRNSIRNIDSDEFTYQDQVDAARSFAQAGVSVNADLTLFGIGVNTKKIGGFAFGIKERIQWYSIFNETTSDILFLGYNAPYFDWKVMTNGDTLMANDPNFNPDSVTSGISASPKLISSLMNGSRVTMSWVREFNFAYGVKLFGVAKDEGEGDKLALFGGIGFKYLAGVAIIDIGSENNQLSAFSAVTPFLDIDYGSAGDANPSAVEQSGGLPNTVGSGMGIDLGLTLTLNDNVKISAAMTDMGSMTWDGNVYQMNDTLVINTNSGGFESYNIFAEAPKILSDSGTFNWDGVVERKEKLPTVIRAGASIMFSEKLEVGIDAVMPANTEPGNIENPLVAAGLDFRALPWLRLSSGLIVGGNYGFNLPAGIGILMGENGGWEMGIATRDVLTYFSPNNPTLSMSFGFLRFRV